MLGGYGLRADDVRGVTRIILESRLTRLQGFHACCWLTGDILIDAGFVKTAPLLLDFLDGKRVRAVACTHHHEDHTGGAGLVAGRHRCPVYLNRPEERFSEGLGDMKFYRRLWWGRPAEYEPEQMPERLEGDGLELVCVPTPGHSATHCAFFDPKGGVLFSGDLYIAPGATAIMSHENPYLLAESLKRVAELEPRYMMTGHGLVMKGPAGALRQKA
ncbi:MAG: MBL fold metallo-hydrolase, partial [Deltaproteobacteria bacterium]